jgi:hypothetical protein
MNLAVVGNTAQEAYAFFSFYGKTERGTYFEFTPTSAG